mmetsp:Transcript_51113/g.91358  ORF Transcript_51113/g.91358 Transcript_51113/m.91358 type:complete len:148 (-) Transcript_51113:1171-1614(-)
MSDNKKTVAIRRGPQKASVPLRILSDAVRSTIAVEMITGEVYRGFLLEVQDNMNCRMNNITVTYRDGRTRHLDHVFIRGSKVRFMVLPDHLMEKFKVHLKIIEDLGRAGKREKRVTAKTMAQKRKAAAMARDSGLKDPAPRKKRRTG